MSFIPFSLNRFLNEFSLSDMESLLVPLLLEKRLELFEEVIQSRIQSIHLAFESPTNIHNVLAAVRSMDAFGLKTAHIIEPQKNQKNRKGRRTTRGSYKWVDTFSYDEKEDFFEKMKSTGVSVIGGVVNGEKTLSDISVDKPLCLMFGNEEFGLSEDAISRCDKTFTIPMFGMVESLNISVASALAVYELSKRKREHLLALGDLTEREKRIERVWFVIKSLGIEKAYMILKSREAFNQSKDQVHTV